MIAFFIINMSQILLHRYCLYFTCLCTKGTSDTACRTDSFYLAPFFSRELHLTRCGASYGTSSISLRGQTSIHFPQGFTFVFIYNSNAINNINGSKFTNCLTGTISGTTICTAFRTVIRTVLGKDTGLRANIIIYILCFFSQSPAHFTNATYLVLSVFSTPNASLMASATAAPPTGQADGGISPLQSPQPVRRIPDIHSHRSYFRAEVPGPSLLFSSTFTLNFSPATPNRMPIIRPTPATTANCNQNCCNIHSHSSLYQAGKSKESNCHQS